MGRERCAGRGAAVKTLKSFEPFKSFGTRVPYAKRT